MSDFLKKVKSIFVEDEGSSTSPATSQSTDNQSQSAASASTAAAPAVTPVATGSLSDKFVELLAKALEQNNQPGFDYFEFRQALANLAKMPMDEQTRFQSAFAMAQTMGATPAGLAESAGFYLKVLAGEQAKFNEAHAQQRSKLIGNREEEIKNLEGAIQQKTQQIADLTRQIEEHRQQSEQIRGEISASTVKIETTKADFDATFASVVTQLQNDVEKIKKYL